MFTYCSFAGAPSYHNRDTLGSYRCTGEKIQANGLKWHRWGKKEKWNFSLFSFLFFCKWGGKMMNYHVNCNPPKPLFIFMKHSFVSNLKNFQHWNKRVYNLLLNSYLFSFAPKHILGVWLNFANPLQSWHIVKSQVQEFNEETGLDQTSRAQNMKKKKGTDLKDR